jgi:hypothetical protein
VRVTAELRLQARARQPGEVAGHDRRGAAIEGERRDQHAPVADRHQLGNAGQRLLLEHADRVAPPGGRLPSGM